MKPRFEFAFIALIVFLALVVINLTSCASLNQGSDELCIDKDGKVCEVENERASN